LKWLKSIFQRNKSRESCAMLKLSDLNSWLDEKSSHTLDEEKVREIYSGIEEVGEGLAKEAEALTSAKPDEAAPPRLLKAGIAARGEVVKQIEALASKLTPPRQTNVESVSEYHWTLVKGLSNTVQKFGRAQSYVAALFPQESDAINSDFNRLSRLLVQLEEEIGKNRKEREEIWYSRELAARIPQELKEIDILLDRVKRDEQKLAELQDTLKRDEAEIKGLASSDEGRKAEELKKTLNSKREELKKIEAEIADLVAPLTKALSRAMKQEASDRISLQHREILEMLSRSPLQALDGDISGPLQEVRSHMAVLGLKDRKKEKVLDHLDYLIAKKPLEALKARHVKLQAEVEDLEKRLAKSISGTVLLNKELAQTRKEIERLEPELSSSRQSLAAQEEKVSNDEAELKERVGKIAGRPVEIDMGRDTNCGGQGL
jgi:DNA repair exonuclease SbcCD ATPase subunit